jgi:hypothetical protein
MSGWVGRYEIERLSVLSSSLSLFSATTPSKAAKPNSGKYSGRRELP